MSFEYFFSFRSPYAWISWTLIRNHPDIDGIVLNPMWTPQNKTLKLLEERGGKYLYTPMSQEKHLYIMHDVKRIACIMGLPLVFPIDKEDTNWELPHVCFFYAQEHGMAKDYIDTVFKTRWEKGESIWTNQDISKILSKLSLSNKILEDEAFYDKYRELAIQGMYKGYLKGVFGIPFLLVGNSKYWGFERISLALNSNDTLITIDERLPDIYNVLDITFDHTGGCG